MAQPKKLTQKEKADKKFREYYDVQIKNIRKTMKVDLYTSRLACMDLLKELRKSNHSLTQAYTEAVLYLARECQSGISFQ